MLRVTWEAALAWRMRRHLLDPISTLPVVDVVRRLCGVQAQVASSADLAVRIRSEQSRPGAVGEALADGRLIKTWAMRGTLHVLTPDDAGSYLSLLAAGKSWERPSWVKYFGVSQKHWEILRPTVREALDGKPMTREELVAKVTATPGLDHVGEALRSGWGTLLKPLAWQGDLCFGPSVGTRVTFMRPEAASPTWTGVPQPDEAAPAAIASYLRAYGPATADGFSNWLSRGRIAKKQLKAWFAGLGNRLADVDLDGEAAYVLAEDADELAATEGTTTVRLLPGFDQWVLGPGTDDIHVIAAARRTAVSKQSGWIAPIVLVGGVVRGTWGIDDRSVAVAWFGEGGKPPAEAIEEEVARLSTIMGRRLGTAVTVV